MNKDKNNILSENISLEEINLGIFSKHLKKTKNSYFYWNYQKANDKNSTQCKFFLETPNITESDNETDNFIKIKEKFLLYKLTEIYNENNILSECSYKKIINSYNNKEFSVKTFDSLLQAIQEIDTNQIIKIFHQEEQLSFDVFVSLISDLSEKKTKINHSKKDNIVLDNLKKIYKEYFISEETYSQLINDYKDKKINFDNLMKLINAIRTKSPEEITRIWYKDNIISLQLAILLVKDITNDSH